MVTSGFPWDNGIHSEVIDTANPDVVCDPLPNLPMKLAVPFGGLLMKNQPTICGGNSDCSEQYCSQSYCYVIGNNETVAELNEPRSGSQSVVLGWPPIPKRGPPNPGLTGSATADRKFSKNGETEQALWVTGGFVSNTPSNSTEFIRLDQPVLPGPDLPTKYFRHCITKINEDLVALIGGYNTETTTLLVDVSHGWWQG